MTTNEYIKIKEFEKEYCEGNVIEYDDVLFCVKGKKLLSVVAICNDIPTNAGINTIININNKSFFKKTQHLLYCNNFIKALVKLLRMYGYDITETELMKEYEEIEKERKREAEKWKRIKKAWKITTWKKNDNID